MTSIDCKADLQIIMVLPQCFRKGKILVYISSTLIIGILKEEKRFGYDRRETDINVGLKECRFRHFEFQYNLDQSS